MIIHPAFPPELWDIRERGLDLSVLAQSESLFTLSNGHSGCAATSMSAIHTDFRGPI